VLDLELYDRETACDWTSGSFMLARKATVDDVGPMDERFFLYCEETDFCLRIRQAGWSIVHLPQMTIFHQSSKDLDAQMSSQSAFARRQYMAKHFGRVHRLAGMLALGLGYALRSVTPGGGLGSRRRRASSRAALTSLLGLTPPPFEYASGGDAEPTAADEGRPGV
jgi:GT2 family glycosyltransferase